MTPFNPEFTELDSVVDETITGSFGLYEFYNPDTDEWYIRAYTYHPEVDQSTARIDKRRQGEDWVTHATIEMPVGGGNYPGFKRAGRWWLVWTATGYEIVNQIIAWTGDGAASAAYFPTFGFGKDGEPDDGFDPFRVRFYHFGSGVLAAYMYRIPNPYGEDVAYFPSITAAGASVTLDPTTDDGWMRIPVTAYPRDYFTEADAESDDNSGPGFVGIGPASENETTISIPCTTHGYSFVYDNAAIHYVRLEYDKAAQVWNKREVANLRLTGEPSGPRGIGDRWLTAELDESYQRVFKLSDSGDIADTYTELTYPIGPDAEGLWDQYGINADAYAPDDGWIALPSGQWLAPIAKFIEVEDEWSNTYWLTRYKWLLLSTDWSETIVLEDSVELGTWAEVNRGGSGNGLLTSADAQPAIPLLIFTLSRFVDPDDPDYGWWDYSRTEYIVLSPDGGAGGWD